MNEELIEPSYVDLAESPESVQKYVRALESELARMQQALIIQQRTALPTGQGMPANEPGTLWDQASQAYLLRKQQLAQARMQQREQPDGKNPNATS